MKICVVGSGISGLSAAWLLSKKYPNEVHLYEANDYLGGHTNSVEIVGADRKYPFAVDTGFIVYNDHNYPNLKAMFRTLGVKTEPSDMSFGLSVADGKLEWSSDGLGTVFAQWKNLFSPSHWAMLRDIMRFQKDALTIIDKKEFEDMTLQEFLESRGYSQSFIDNYILPVISAVWSSPMRGVLNFPAQTLMQFMHNHQLLQIMDRPQWRTVSLGSWEYVKKIKQELDGNGCTIKLSTPVTSVKREKKGDKLILTVKDVHGGEQTFDHVVFACHADQVLQVLDASKEEKDLLSVFQYSTNVAILHSDESFMPKIKSVWSSWNYLRENFDQGSKGTLTYWMNRLQPFLPVTMPLFVTLNPYKEPNPRKVHKKILYTHPIYVPKVVKSQKKLRESPGKNGVHFIGAYCGFGFHEDGLLGGLRAATELGAECPWTIDHRRYVTASMENPLGSSTIADWVVLIICFIIMLVAVFYLLTA